MNAANYNTILIAGCRKLLRRRLFFATFLPNGKRLRYGAMRRVVETTRHVELNVLF